MLIDKVLILNALKEYYSFKSDVDFAKFLGIATTTLSSWYARKSLNWDTLFAKCVDINFEVLIREGRAISNKTKKLEITDYNKNALEMIRDLAAENALLKDKLQRIKSKNYGNLAAES